MNADQMGMKMVGKFGSVDMSAAALKQTGVLEEGEAKMQGGQEVLAMNTIVPIVEKLNEMVEKINKFFETKEDSKGTETLVDSNEELISALEKSTSAILKQTAIQMRNTAFNPM
jgi:uncharacterized FlaG/YvyC family protein